MMKKFQKDFLSEVPQELLKPSGHAVGSFATKWIHKKNDGIYFQSQNGIIRLQPIAPNIVRVSYSKGLMLDIPKSDAYKSFQLYLIQFHCCHKIYNRIYSNVMLHLRHFLL